MTLLRMATLFACGVFAGLVSVFSGPGSGAYAAAGIYCAVAAWRDPC